MAAKHKVLVFPAGTEIAFEIHNALRHSKFVELYGATSVPCHAEMVFKECASGLPFVKDPALIDALNEVIDMWGIEYVYPAHDDALLILTREQSRLHAKVVTSPWETVAVCRSKLNTYCELYGVVDYLPKFWMNENDVDEFPVFVKPDIGQGGIGAQRVNNRKELDRILSDGTEYAICEYLPGREFTVDCFTDRHGNLLYVGQRTRERIRAGIAVRSRFMVFTDAPVLRIANDLNHRFRFNGAWFFQVKEDREGNLKLMEVAPRIAGTMGLSRNRGINMPLLTLYNMLGVDVHIIDNGADIMLDRAFISRYKNDIEYYTVYVDLDDTLIQDGKVNEFLLAYLHQAREKGKRVILLTKHEGWLERDLVDLHINPNMFSDIINIGKRKKTKADFIKGDKAIFIDDSYSERRLVKEQCGIPVFDVDMVESLYDWCA